MSHHQPTGYFALPTDLTLSSKGRAVLVLHPWWGLNDTIKAVCWRLAEAGFVAFAPDLYYGKVVDTIPDAEEMAGTVFGNLEQARANLTAATTFLSAYTAQTDGGLAVIGFSLGAFFALDLSVTMPDLIRSVVLFYGTRPGDYSGSQAAYLGHFAETDEFEPASEVDALGVALKEARRPMTFHHYEGTSHWFFEPDRTQAYHPEAADLAWDRTLAFLRES